MRQVLWNFPQRRVPAHLTTYFIAPAGLWRTNMKERYTFIVAGRTAARHIPHAQLWIQKCQMIHNIRAFIQTV